MAQRAAGSSKKLQVVKAAFASVSASDVIRAPSRALPLDLAPLLKPYKRQGKLTLRVERLPQLARLSAGRNNGDGTWSLALDDLEGLTYLLPEDLIKDHTLAIRIMAYDGTGATTLKLLDYPVSPGTAEVDQLPEAHSQPHVMLDLDAPALPTPLHDELANLRTVLAFRDSELAEARQVLEQARKEIVRTEGELAAARAASRSDLNERLSAVAAQAASQIEQARQVLEAEQKVRTAEATAEMERCIARERDRWQQESSDALSKAKEHWKAEEALRLATAQTEWRDKSARPLAEAVERCRNLETALVEARAKADGGAARSEEGLRELSRLRGEMTALRASLVERDSDLMRLRRGNDQARARWSQEAETTLSNAAAAWKAEEAGRLAAAKTAWDAQSAGALAQATERCRTLEAALAEERNRPATTPPSEASERELARLRGDLAALRASLADCEGELSQLRRDGEQARERWRQEAETSLTNAGVSWKADEARRLAIAKADWDAHSARALALASERNLKLETALAEERVRAAAAARDGSESDADRLRGELTAARAALAEREGELAQQRTNAEKERGRWRQETETALVNAGAAWKADEAKRVADAERRWRDQAAPALAQATKRYETAEAALASARSQAAEVRGDDAYIARLRGELAASQASLVDREAELAHARSAIDQLRPHHAQETGGHGYRAAWLAEEPQPRDIPKSKNHLARDFILVVALVMSAILFYPRYEAFLPDGLRARIATMTVGFAPAPADKPSSPPPETKAPVAPKPQMAVVGHGVNVRAAPSSTGAIVLKLPRSTQVAIIEQRGNWTLVETPAADGKPQQGWVFSTYLTAADPGSKKTPAAPPH